MAIKLLRISALASLCVAGWLGMAGCHPREIHADHTSPQIPRIFPDYTNVTFPVNIAPANFYIQEPGASFRTEIGVNGEVLFSLSGNRPEVVVPERRWRALLQQAEGKNFFIRIFVKQENGWTQYADIQNHVSPDSVDAFLAYRLLYPGYELWNEMGIYQRELSSFRVEPILENRRIGKQCLNCHTVARQNPENFMLHVRGKDNGTLIRRGGKVEKVASLARGASHGNTYAAWDPSGRFIAFSMNEIQQFFHATGQKPIEVSDLAADLGVYDTETHVLHTDSALFGADGMETFPAWSPDGRTLFYCRGNAYTRATPLDSLRYDLYAIPFDASDLRAPFGEPRCLYAASREGKSVSFPRVSPDGNWLLFTLSDYGNFSIWHPESDLYLMDLRTGQFRAAQELNSPDVESFHTWSSSGNWLVLSSKRIDGLWARPFIAHFDTAAGQFAKPFLLPQKDPHFYETFTRTFNLPEFLTAPVTFQRELLEAVPQQASDIFLQVQK